GGPAILQDGSDWYLVRVEMTVMDVNDNVPEWSMAPVPYLAVVSPEAVPGSLVYQLFARDDDAGDNGEVEFFLSDVPAVLRADLDAGEPGAAGSFVLQAVDADEGSNGRTRPLTPGICELKILILDQNDNSPKFENLRYECWSVAYFLREDTMIVTSFFRVAAHDDDFSTNATVAYSMSNEQPEYLRVNPLTGWMFPSPRAHTHMCVQTRA
ncbi:hypothetical protein NHX12_005296, partial [Muraenolepis orangiensis]